MEPAATPSAATPADATLGSNLALRNTAKVGI